MWDIRVRHDDIDGRVRLTIEAGAEVPEEVIAALAGSYWEEEVRYAGEWTEDEEFDENPGPPGGFHG